MLFFYINFYEYMFFYFYLYFVKKKNSPYSKEIIFIEKVKINIIYHYIFQLIFQFLIKIKCFSYHLSFRYQMEHNFLTLHTNESLDQKKTTAI